LGNVPAFLSQLINFYFNGEPAAQDRGGFLVRQARCEGRAHATAEERDRCLAAGMRGHIAKPIDPELLYRTLLQFHRSGQAARASKSVERSSHSAALPKIAGLDVTDGLNRVAGNVKLYRSLLAQFADQQVDSVSAIRVSSDAGLQVRNGGPFCETTRRTSPPWICS
jgi:hypothetical protein